MDALLLSLATLLSASIEPESTPAPPPVTAPQPADQASRVPDPAPDLQVRLLAGVWLPRLGGTSALGAGAPDINLQQDLQLDTQEPTPNLELSIRRRDIWQITLSGFGFETDSLGTFAGSATFGALALNTGDVYRAALRMTSYAVELSAAVYRPYAPGATRAEAIDDRAWNGRPVADFRIAPLLGMRWVDVSQSISSGGVSAEGQGEWTAIYAGVNFEFICRPQDKVPMYDALLLEASFAAGPALGGDGGLMWQIRAGATLQFTEWLGVEVGYRLVELNVENGDYSFNAGLQGLFLAGSLRF